jgi:hypothetical protein
MATRSERSRSRDARSLAASVSVGSESVEPPQARSRRNSLVEGLVASADIASRFVAFVSAGRSSRSADRDTPFFSPTGNLTGDPGPLDVADPDAISSSSDSDAPGDTVPSLDPRLEQRVGATTAISQPERRAASPVLFPAFSFVMGSPSLTSAALATAQFGPNGSILATTLASTQQPCETPRHPAIPLTWLRPFPTHLLRLGGASKTLNMQFGWSRLHRVLTAYDLPALSVPRLPRL